MNRLFSFILIVAMLLTLSACTSNNTPKLESTNASTQKIELDTPSTSKKGPSQNLIQADLTDALTVLPNAVLTSISTVKSLTEDNRSEITLQMTVATTYADWHLECDMSYTKYDQGWMLDEVDWNSKDYVVARIPDIETISQIANNTEVSTYYKDILPVENGVIDSSSLEEHGFIELHWTKIQDYMHAQCIGYYTTQWAYNAEIDNWVFSPCDDSFGFLSNETITPYPVDFTGNWDGIEISNFTWEGFDVKCDEIEAYFYKVSGPPYSNKSSYGWYTDGNGKYLQIQCGPLGSSLAIRSFGHVMTQYAYAGVQQELPFL